MIVSVPYIRKKMRSKRSRLHRPTISPVLFNSHGDNDKGLSTLSVDSSSCSYFGDEISSKARKRKCDELVGGNKTTKKKTVEDAPFRRITRLYCKKLKDLENYKKGIEAEVSESSCVLSYTGAVNGETSSKLKEVNGNEKRIEPNDISRSQQVSCIKPAEVCNDSLKFGVVNLKSLLENKDNDDVISFNSDVESCSVTKLCENRAARELSYISKSDIVESNFNISNSEFILDQKPGSIKLDSDLACSEQLSYDDGAEYSSSHETVFSELQREIFPDDSDLDFSDYTPSSFYDSGSEFSERSADDTSPPSRTYSLFLEFFQQFSRSTFPLESQKRSPAEETYQNHSRLVRFQDKEDEESYRRFRERERRHKFLHDYAMAYLSTAECGDLIIQQRSLMVNWIVEQCNAKEFQRSTMFLGVSLFDRFLSRGFFRTQRNLQIVGIACLALATRIEENQPYNSVREKNFHIGCNVYSRCEVVAMEWLVQEILNFQCLLPTIYNFLWFYLKAAEADAEVEKKANYLAVLALSDHEQLCYWPSTVAAAVVILASIETHAHTSFRRVIEIHIRTEDNDLPDCLQSLEYLVQLS